MTRLSGVALSLGSSLLAFALWTLPSGASEKPATPPPEKKTAEDYPGGAELAAARKAFLGGHHRRAIELAKTKAESYPEVAWRIIGASSCSLKNERGALEAFGHLDAEGKALLELICDRAGIKLH